jgi:hypothetical protein
VAVLLVAGLVGWLKYREARFEQFRAEMQKRGVIITSSPEDPDWVRKIRDYLPETIVRVLQTPRHYAATDSACDGETLKQLATLPYLTQLRSIGPACLDDEVLSSLTACKRLQQLFFRVSRVTDESIRSFQSMPGLRTVELGSSQFTVAGVDGLMTLSQIESIHVHVPPENFRHIRPMSIEMITQAVRGDYYLSSQLSGKLECPEALEPSWYFGMALKKMNESAGDPILVTLRDYREGSYQFKTTRPLWTISPGEYVAEYFLYNAGGPRLSVTFARQPLTVKKVEWQPANPPVSVPPLSFAPNRDLEWSRKEVRMTAPLTDVRGRLHQLRAALYRLHKSLLDSERLAYEAEYGPIRSNGQYLQLLINDPRFTWLQPYTSLVVRIDEAVESKEPEALNAAGEFWVQARWLTNELDGGTQAAERYHAALERHRPASEAHGVVLELFEGS